MAHQRRLFRVAERIREIVSSQLMRSGDPRFALVTITSVITSRDLRHAKIYWIVSGGPERKAQVEEAFSHASGLFKRVLAEELGARFVPEVRFYYDDTLDTQEEVNRLFDIIANERNENSES